MNELKRQLNEKMGDTSEHTASVIQKIEAGKKMKRQSRKFKFSGPIYVAIASFVTVLALFFLIGPWSDEEKQNANDPSPTPPAVTEPDNTEDPTASQKELLRKYFKKDGDVAYFKGSGNEYASFTETTTWINDDYVQILVDNGGSITQNIYRITDDSIELIIARNAEDGVVTPFVEDLITLQPLSTVLVAPLENQKNFENKTMFTNIPFKTSYKDFNTTLVEYVNEGTKVSKYYAEDFGLIGEVYTMEDGYKVESFLTSLNEAPTADDSRTIDVYNSTTKSTDKYLIKDLPFIDPYIFEANPDYYNMTYSLLDSVGDTEVGILTYTCDEREHCSHVFVSKQGENLSIIAHAWGSYGNIGISPNKEFLIIPINSTEQDGNSFVERNQLLLINLYTFKQYIPDEAPAYFEATTYPIVSYKWENDTLTVTAGAVKSFSHADLAAWEKLTPRPTKDIAVKITAQ